MNVGGVDMEGRSTWNISGCRDRFHEYLTHFADCVANIEELNNLHEVPRIASFVILLVININRNV